MNYYFFNEILIYYFYYFFYIRVIIFLFVLFRLGEFFLVGGLCLLLKDLLKWLLFLLGNGIIEDGFIFIDKIVFDEMFEFYVLLLRKVMMCYSVERLFLVVLLIVWYGYVWFG